MAGRAKTATTWNLVDTDKRPQRPWPPRMACGDGFRDTVAPRTGDVRATAMWSPRLRVPLRHPELHAVRKERLLPLVLRPHRQNVCGDRQQRVVGQPRLCGRRQSVSVTELSCPYGNRDVAWSAPATCQSLGREDRTILRRRHDAKASSGESVRRPQPHGLRPAVTPAAMYSRLSAATGYVVASIGPIAPGQWTRLNGSSTASAAQPSFEVRLRNSSGPRKRDRQHRHQHVGTADNRRQSAVHGKIRGFAIDGVALRRASRYDALDGGGHLRAASSTSDKSALGNQASRFTDTDQQRRLPSSAHVRWRRRQHCGVPAIGCHAHDDDCHGRGGLATRATITCTGDWLP
jgi:hypothetical protein